MSETFNQFTQIKAGDRLKDTAKQGYTTYKVENVEEHYITAKVEKSDRGRGVAVGEQITMNRSHFYGMELVS